MRNPRAPPGGVWGESRERNVHLKLNSCSFSNFIAIISSRSVCQMLANFVVWQQCITKVQEGFLWWLWIKCRCVVGWQTKVWGKNPPRSTGFFIIYSASSNNWLVSGHSTDCTLLSFFFRSKNYWTECELARKARNRFSRCLNAFLLICLEKIESLWTV